MQGGAPPVASRVIRTRSKVIVSIVRGPLVVLDSLGFQPPGTRWRGVKEGRLATT